MILALSSSRSGLFFFASFFTSASTRPARSNTWNTLEGVAPQPPVTGPSTAAQPSAPNELGSESVRGLQSRSAHAAEEKAKATSDTARRGNLMDSSFLTLSVVI